MTSFSTIDKQALARRLLPVINQGGSSIGGYIAEFNRLLTEHGSQQPNSTQCVDWFLGGLKNWLRSRLYADPLTNAPWQDWRRLADAAKRLDDASALITDNRHDKRTPPSTSRHARQVKAHAAHAPMRSREGRGGDRTGPGRDRDSGRGPPNGGRGAHWHESGPSSAAVHKRGGGYGGGHAAHQQKKRPPFGKTAEEVHKMLLQECSNHFCNVVRCSRCLRRLAITT